MPMKDDVLKIKAQTKQIRETREGLAREIASTVERSYPTDPTPLETLDYIAAACSALVEERWQVDSSTSENYARVTLEDVRRCVAAKMAKSGDRFSRDYRHESTSLHSVCYQILGSTVGINWMADDIAERAAQ